MNWNNPEQVLAQFRDELSCPYACMAMCMEYMAVQRWTFLPTCVHKHGKFNNKLSCPHVKQLSKLQKTIQRWTLSEVTIRGRTIQRWMFCSSEFYYIIILLICLHDIPWWNFNIGAHWLTFLLIYLSNWAEMRFNTTLSVPNFHLNAHISCERVFELPVRCEVTITINEIQNNSVMNVFAKRGDNFMAITHCHSL